MTIQELIQKKKNLGWSNARLSEASGVPVSTVNKVFSGATRNPRHETIAAIEIALARSEALSGQDLKAEKNPVQRTYPEYEVRDDTKLLMVKEAQSVYGRNYPESLKSKRLYTVDDLEVLDEGIRAELYDGELIVMETPNLMHQRMVTNLWRQLDDYIESHECSCIAAAAPLDVRMNPEDRYNALQPDVLVICDESIIIDSRIKGAPVFVAEIVSKSTAARDYRKKMVKYAEGGVKEYWIIDPYKRCLVIYRFEEDACPQILPLSGKTGVGLCDGDLQIDLDAFAKIIDRGY